MDTGKPLFFPEIQYLLLVTIPLEIIMRVLETGVKSDPAFCLGPSIEKTNREFFLHIFPPFPNLWQSCVIVVNIFGF